MPGSRRPVIATAVVAVLWLSSWPATCASADSLENRLDDIQMSLDALQAESVLRAADRSLADCQAAFARGETSCMMPRFCVDAIEHAAPGDRVICDGYAFVKPLPTAGTPSTLASLPEPPQAFIPLSNNYKSLDDSRNLVPCTPAVFVDTPEGEAQQQAARQSVFAYLDAAPSLSGRWRQINVAPGFLAWLAGADPKTGCERRAELLSAFNAGDARSTAAFFLTYLSDRAAAISRLDGFDARRLSGPLKGPVTSDGKPDLNSVACSLATLPCVRDDRQPIAPRDTPGAAEYPTQPISSDDPSYKYIPTQQDREEVRACVAAASPDTTAIDCVMPTVNRITSAMIQETGSQQWPPHPSQATVMIEVAGLKCGMPTDNPEAPVPRWAKPCLDAETRKAVTAIITALQDYLDSTVK